MSTETGKGKKGKKAEMSLDVLKEKLCEKQQKLRKSLRDLDNAIDRLGNAIDRLGNEAGKNTDEVWQALWEIQQVHLWSVLALDNYETWWKEELRKWSL